MTIKLENIYKTVGGARQRRQVLNGLSGVLPGDRVVGIIGEPGGGKTTLLNVIGGIDKPDRGRVERLQHVSFPVGNGGAFNGLLTCRENIVFVSRVFGFDPKPIIVFIDEFAELGASLDRQLKQLNKEDKLRFVQTAAYAMPFEVYIADNNFLGGRGEFRTRLEELVRYRLETAGGVVCTSAPAILRQFCNVYFALKDGLLIEAETADEAIAMVDLTGKKSGIDIVAPEDEEEEMVD